MGRTKVIIATLACWCALILSLTACVGNSRTPVPMQMDDTVVVAGVSNRSIRFWGDELPVDVDEKVAELWAERRAARPRSFAGGTRPVVNYLALSGGGSDGAFGAGVLNGWTARGDRPQFDLVTGISTGALSAPFAFLGPKYDGALRHVFTESHTKDIAIIQPVKGLLGGSSLASNAPLAKVIAYYVDENFLKEVAAEHAKGRRLYIGTTNLDAQRPVIWNMGEIAASDSPEAVELFRKVLLSSAAIPGVFPPGIIEVAASGAAFDEMHVDGGTTRQAFLFPAELRLKNIDSRIGIKPVRRAYIIRNGKVAPEWSAVKPRILSIGARSVSTLIKTQGIGDLYELYEISRVNGIDYNVTYIPEDFNVTSSDVFDPEYMGALYELGSEMARSGRLWKKKPPLLE